MSDFGVMVLFLVLLGVLMILTCWLIDKVCNAISKLSRRKLKQELQATKTELEKEHNERVYYQHISEVMIMHRDFIS